MSAAARYSVCLRPLIVDHDGHRCLRPVAHRDHHQQHDHEHVPAPPNLVHVVPSHQHFAWLVSEYSAPSCEASQVNGGEASGVDHVTPPGSFTLTPVISMLPPSLL